MPGQGAEWYGLHGPGNSTTQCHPLYRVRRSQPGLCGRHAHPPAVGWVFGARCGRDQYIAEPGKKYGSRH